MALEINVETIQFGLVTGFTSEYMAPPVPEPGSECALPEAVVKPFTLPSEPYDAIDIVCKIDFNNVFLPPPIYNPPPVVQIDACEEFSATSNIVFTRADEPEDAEASIDLTYSSIPDCSLALEGEIDLGCYTMAVDTDIDYLGDGVTDEPLEITKDGTCGIKLSGELCTNMTVVNDITINGETISPTEEPAPGESTIFITKVCGEDIFEDPECPCYLKLFGNITIPDPGCTSMGLLMATDEFTCAVPTATTLKITDVTTDDGAIDFMDFEVSTIDDCTKCLRLAPNANLHYKIMTICVDGVYEDVKIVILDA